MTVSGRASTGGTTTRTARAGTSATRPRSWTTGPRPFEFDPDWAENSTRPTCDDDVGLAHFECVVIRRFEEWSAR